MLKRSISGTYISVEPFHCSGTLMSRLRFSNRLPMADGARFSYLVRKVTGKRLTYAELTGKTDDREAQ